MGISNKYDNIFEKFRGTIPLSYLRALAFSQSNLNAAKSFKGAAGLFMISDAALRAYDKKYPIAATNQSIERKSSDLADPILNTRIAVWILGNIIKYFSTHYPKTMSENWNDPTYAAVVTLAFNVGYTEPQGIGAAIKALESKPDKFSMESLVQVAKEIKLDASKYSDKMVSYAKTVANLYVADLGGKAPVKAPGPPTSTDSPTALPKSRRGMGTLMLLPVLGLGALVFMRGKKK